MDEKQQTRQNNSDYQDDDDLDNKYGSEENI